MVGKVVQENGKNDVINLDHGNPTLLEPFWQKMDEKCAITISGCQFLSYFSNIKNICWFLEPKLEEEIKRLHSVTGNALAKDYHIVVGNGSTQLIHAALFALSSQESEPVDVVSAAPYYSCYPEATSFLRSGLYKWAGDANTYDKGGSYIEFVTSPNNPDGSIREAVVKGGKGKLIHDLAYYWPQYTPITHCAKHDIMLFTMSKCTGHAGSRIGWALVKDDEVAKKMTKYIEVNTIGVSKESQIRAAKILCVISHSSQFLDDYSDNFFLFAQHQLARKWEKLREVVGCSEMFSLPNYPKEFCNFKAKISESHAAFAWLKWNNIEDLEKFLRGNNIITRGGNRFGVNESYVRISMLGDENDFDLFLERLLAIQGSF